MNFLARSPNRNGNRVIATDVDDVLVQCTIPWVGVALDHPVVGPRLRSLDPRFAGEPAQLVALILERPVYYIQTWLAEVGLTPEEVEIVANLYRHDHAFYDDLPMTKVFHALIDMLQSHPGDSCHIITHCFAQDEGATHSKVRWLKRNLDAHMPGWASQVTIHAINDTVRKSDVLVEHAPSVDVFVDDSLRHVIDVLSNGRCFAGQIAIPAMGHNRVLPENALVLAKLRGVALTHYADIL